MDSSYHCAECTSDGLTWKETSVDREDAPGVANARMRALAKARELTRQLQAHFERDPDRPVWVAVQVASKCGKRLRAVVMVLAVDISEIAVEFKVTMLTTFDSLHPKESRRP